MHGLPDRCASLVAVALFAGAGVTSAQTASDAHSHGTSDVARVRNEAIAYEHGEGVPKDPLKAAALYCEAGRAGDAEALYNLGWMYANGRGVERDDGIAFALFTRAARAGDTQAPKMLAFLSGAGDRIPDCLKPPPPVIIAPAEAAAQSDPYADLPPDKRRMAELVTEVAPSYGIEPRLALAVVTVESNFQPRARSEKDARGLMQLIPQTAARFKVKDPYDANQNVRGGLAYLRWLLAYYRGQVALAAAAYNAGEKAVDHYGGIPPFAETREYVRKILILFRRDQHPFDAQYADPSPVVSAPGAR